MTHAVSRRLLPLLALVAFALPAVGFSQSAPNRAGVVVQFGDGRIQTACVTFPETEINGIDLLNRANINYTAQATGMGAAMCAIEGEGCAYPAQDCFCQCKGAPCVYWRLYNASGNTWQLAGVGASSTKIRNGDVQAWVWGGGTFAQGEAPEGIAPADVCPVPTTAPPNPTAQPTARPVVPTPRSPVTRTPLPPTATRPPTAVPRTPTPQPSATAQPRPPATQPAAPTAVPPTSTAVPTARPNPTTTVRVVPPTATLTVVPPTATTRVVPPTGAPPAIPTAVPAPPTFVPVQPTAPPPTPTDALNAAALPSIVPFASASAQAETSTVSVEATPSPTQEPSPTATTVILPTTPVPTAPVAPSVTALIAGGEEGMQSDAAPNQQSLPLDPLIFVGAFAVLLFAIFKLRRRQQVD